jgi:hypothetical protein
MFLSLWRTDGSVVATAFVDYRPPGVLVYRELLMARPVRAGATPAVRITDIWVDSESSRDGGRALWAIPKELATFTVDGDTWSMSVDGAPVASASFHRGRRVPMPLPARFRASQPREGSVVLTPVRGRARVTLASARWTFEGSAALAFLSGTRPFLSLVLTDFRISFGR